MPRPERGWARATFVGWLLGFVLILVLLGVAGALGMGDLQFPVGLGMGLGVGLIQSRRPSLRSAGVAWSASSALGVAAPFLVGDLAKVLDHPLPYSLAVYVVIGGVVVGLLQTGLLRRLGLRAGWWALACGLGWSLGAASVLLADHLPRVPGLLGALLYVGVVLAGGMLLGLVQAPVAQRVRTGGADVL